MMISHPVWLFDLDNTLHHADAGIFRLINQHMTAYLAQQLALTPEAAGRPSMQAFTQSIWGRP